MKFLIITIPIGEHQETIQTLHEIGVKMKVGANQIFVDCVNGIDPEPLYEIDRDFSAEVCEVAEVKLNNFDTALKKISLSYVSQEFIDPQLPVAPSFDIPQLEVMG